MGDVIDCRLWFVLSHADDPDDAGLSTMSLMGSSGPEAKIDQLDFKFPCTSYYSVSSIFRTRIFYSATKYK